VRIVFAAAEVAPYAKVGGLADVAGSLPQALAKLGHDVAVYLPLHGSIDRVRHAIPASARQRSVPYGAATARVGYAETVRDGVRVVFIESKRIGRDKVYGYPDDAKRYALFCRAVAEDLASVRPDVVHAHDWHAALLVPMLRRARVATAFTIHNLAYQGRTAAGVLALANVPRGRLAVERPGECNPMARAIAGADVVSTVSERYAQEILTPEFGEGLEGLLATRAGSLHGILNGIDTRFFDPAKDPHIAAHYDASDQSGKAACKSALQRELGLREDPAAPLLGIIGRLVEQKGIDLLTAVAPQVLAASGDSTAGAQICVLGTGDPSYEGRWKELAAAHPGSLALELGFDAALAQRIYAGSDLFMMPSRFEPCGLGQMISLRYGTVPVVRAVGGLADTIHEPGNGFSFTDYAPAALEAAVGRAIAAFRRDGDAWTRRRERGMREDHSWSVSARRYADMYESAARHRRAA
jgi:starch synthase